MVKSILAQTALEVARVVTCVSLLEMFQIDQGSICVRRRLRRSLHRLLSMQS